MNKVWLFLLVGIFMLSWVSAYSSSGATISYYEDGGTNYTVLTYLNDGTFNITEDINNASILVIAGGGGAGKACSHTAGGGGAGGYIYNTSYTISSGNYNIEVGDGGLGATVCDNSGLNGQNSSFSADSYFQANGGGGGGGYSTSTGKDGGSGGGGHSEGDQSGGTAVPNWQGHNGGGGYCSSGGCGGGGAGTAGGNSGGTAGAGLSNSINGTSIIYATGGGYGATYGSSITQNGTGDGGNASASTKNGGSGLVILSFKTQENGSIDVSFITPPTPINNTVTNETITIQINATYTNSSLTNITYYFQNVNGTLISFLFTNETYILNTNLSEGAYNYNVTICGNESIGNTSICATTTTRHILIDVSPPVFNGTSPMGNYDYLIVNQSLDVNWTVVDEGAGLDSCRFDYNNVTYYVNCTANHSTINYIKDVNFLDGYGNDTLGNEVHVQLNWTYSVLQNSLDYSETTSETSQEDFILNLTLGSSVSLSSAYLNYNGTRYGVTINSSGSNRILSSNIQIPLTNTTYNATFFWELTTNAGAINSTSNTQTVNTLKIDDCSVNTNLILNYTVYDEDTRAIMGLGQNITANLYVQLSGDLTGEVYNYYSGTLSNNTILICVDNSLTVGENYRLDALVKYTADDYVTEFNYIDNYLLNSSVAPREVGLYLLGVNNSQEFLITYKDSNLLPVEGAIIELTRQYPELGPNEFISVENMKTDSDGKTIGHFVLSEEIYTLYVRVDGELTATYENQRAFCSNLATGDCQIFLNKKSSTSNPSSFKNYLGIEGLPTYDKTTKELSFSFSTTDGSTKTINLTLYEVNGTSTSQTICSEELTSSAGTLTCTIPAQYHNSTALVVTRVDGTIYDEYYLNIARGPDYGPNSEKYILAFFIVITLPFIAFTSGPMTIICFLLGLILAAGLVLVDVGGFIGPFSAFLWFVIAGLILLIKSSSRRQQI